jgi:hypothetical protein
MAQSSLDLLFKKYIQYGPLNAGSCNCSYSQMIWPDTSWWALAEPKSDSVRLRIPAQGSLVFPWVLSSGGAALCVDGWVSWMERLDACMTLLISTEVC